MASDYDNMVQVLPTDEHRCYTPEELESCKRPSYRLSGDCCGNCTYSSMDNSQKLWCYLDRAEPCMMIIVNPGMICDWHE